MAVNRSGSIKVQGLKELRAELKTLEDPKALEDELKDVHYRIAVKIETGASPRLKRIKGGMGAAAENTLSARKSVTGAQIELGGADVPWAQGVEFGAKNNLRRIVKNTRKYRGITLANGRKKNIREGGRATIVRDEEDLDDVIGRIREQTIDFSRRNTKKRFRGGAAFQVDAATYAGGRRAGQTIVMRGWNQFLPWRGIGENAGYAIFPTIRDNQENIRKMYEEEVGSITRRAFPD
jgi:hypothetical protein